MDANATAVVVVGGIEEEALVDPPLLVPLARATFAPLLLLW